MLYHPGHAVKATLSHISKITKQWFVVGSSITERTIPIGLAQSVLKLKLSRADIECAVAGDALDAGERIIWRHWLDEIDACDYRKQKLYASPPIDIICSFFRHRKHKK